MWQRTRVSKRLTMRKLDIHLPAVTLDQTERIELSRAAVIDERSEVAPVDLETLAGGGLHAHKGAPRFAFLPDRMQVIANDRMAAVETLLPKPLLDDSARASRILLEQSCNSRLERIQFAGTGSLNNAGRRVGQVLVDGVTADMKMARNLANRPVLDKAQAMNRGDLLIRQHRVRVVIRTIRTPTRWMFFSRWRRPRGWLSNRLKNEDFGGSQVVLYKILHPGSDQPNSAAERFRSKAKVFFARFWRRRR